jgi:hypothetical protein
MKNYTTSDFVEKARKIHGHKYDYTKTTYIHGKDRVIINCSIHGDFNQTPNHHLSGCGCPKCSGNEKSTSEKFIINSIKVHGNKYDYSKVDYKTVGKKVEIICQKHGEFFQTPNSHLKGRGCFYCGGTYKLLSEEFVEKSKKIHNDKYEYFKMDYKNCREKVNIICPVHGRFLQEPGNHMQGQGCPKCTHHISKPEIEFLNYVNVPDTEENRQKYIKPYKVDGIIGNVIYEFLGDYYHGNPQKFNKTDAHPSKKTTFGELYENTIKKLKHLKNSGYTVKYIWESDWKRFKLGVDVIPDIITF